MPLPEAEQVFGDVAGELRFIREVSSSLGVYSLFVILFNKKDILLFRF